MKLSSRTGFHVEGLLLLPRSLLSADDLLQLPFAANVLNWLQGLVDLGKDRLGRCENDRAVLLISTSLMLLQLQNSEGIPMLSQLLAAGIGVNIERTFVGGVGDPSFAASSSSFPQDVD